MKKIVLLIMVLGAMSILYGRESAFAGEMNVLVDKLVEKGVLTPIEGQIILSEAESEMAQEIAEGKAVTAPEWTQKIKMKGDVRFRTQLDWDKNNPTSYASNYDIRERIRARIGVEGKVNDQVYGGVRFATGSSTDPRSTNHTLGDGSSATFGGMSFQKKNAWFDQFYIRWEPKLDEFLPLPTVTPLFNNSKLWMGKFENPFVTTSMVWDGDITPEGIAYQWMSPTFRSEYLSAANVFANIGLFWVDELLHIRTSSMLSGFQGGVQMEFPFEGLEPKLKLAAGWFPTTHFQNRAFSNSAGTNSRWGVGYPASDTHAQYYNTNMYNQDWIEFSAFLDNKKLAGYDLPNGLWTNIAANPTVNKNNWAWSIGAYLGKEKVGKPGEWKMYGEWRYIERDSLPDILPDSDFYGFDTTGNPQGGGTNGQGFIVGGDYGLFNNTVLSVKYLVSWPIGNPYLDHRRDLLQFDVNTKF